MNNLTAVVTQNAIINLEDSSEILNKVFYETVTHKTACTVTLEEYLELCNTCPENYEQSLEFTDRPTQIIFSSPTASRLLKALKNGEKILQPVKLFVGLS
ncbi:hypothetical protein [Paraglaciecola marina]|uniref:hypothetical protein n=1 Tax=Paraglaciecola marina TaxID=2500157 RepID=UPI001061A451|nr:hypothetical protein [Paraglaciecola marina]